MTDLSKEELRKAMNIGDKVIFTGTIKLLESGLVGVISSISGNNYGIVYPQNTSYNCDENGDWDGNIEPNKGKPKVYAHSANKEELILVK